MKFKNLGALFLLSLASVYFICPVQCAAIQETGDNTVSNRGSSSHQYQIGSQTADEMNQSTCCQSENQPSTTHEHQDKEEGHCCFNQWESLGSSEPQLPSQIQKDTLSVVLLIPTTDRIFSDSVFFATYLQLPYKPYTDLTIPQLSPRAPPFFLA